MNGHGASKDAAAQSIGYVQRPPDAFTDLGLLRLVYLYVLPMKTDIL